MVEGRGQGGADGEQSAEAGGVETALDCVADRAYEGEAGGPVGVDEVAEEFFVAEAEGGEVDDQRPRPDGCEGEGGRKGIARRGTGVAL